MLFYPDAKAAIEDVQVHMFRSRFTLSTETLDGIAALHDALAADEIDRVRPAYLHEDEWLVAVDPDGEDVPADPLRSDWERTTANRPAITDWIRPQPVNGRDVWAAQRWFAHLIGLRHRVIHILIEPPSPDAAVMLQLRSFDKANAPGRFDVTVGGHVSAGATADSTLAEEIREELNLDADRDLEDLTARAEYDFPGADEDGEYANTEYRHVYRARLTADAFARIDFQDNEAAGLMIMRRSSAERLMDTAPERIATGLRESYGYAFY